MNRVIHIVINTFLLLWVSFHSGLYAQNFKEVRLADLQAQLERSQGRVELSTPGTFSRAVLSDSSNSVLPDSLRPRTFLLQEVVVTASRVPQTSFYTPLSVTVLSRDEIESTNATSLAQVVSASSGIFIKDYGATSGLKTISQRGMGTEHTLILLNGVRVSSMQNGLVDLGLVPVDDIESVEIVRGGQSASYGADAVAGLINVITRPAHGNGFRAMSSFGSFGYRRYQVAGSLSSGLDGLPQRGLPGWGVRLSYGEERSEEDFPFRFRNGPLVWNLARKNSDLVARYASAQGALAMDRRTQLTVVASTYSSERGIGGSVVSPFSNSRARQTDTDHLIQASFSSDVEQDVSIGCTAQAHLAYEGYRDPNLNIGGSSLDTYFRNDDVRIEPHVGIKSDGVRLTVGTEFVGTTAKGNSLAREVGRKQLGTFIAGEVVLVTTNGIFADVSVFPALRYDAISSMAPTWSPQVGVLVALGGFDAGVIKRVRPVIRSSVSRNFRMPTFNELYFSGGGGLGNPALRPERSTSVDVGGSVQFLFAGEHLLQGTYFLNDMKDRIVWAAAGNSNVSPKNLRHVRSAGFEASYRWNLPNRILSLQTSYAASDSRKKSADFQGDPTINTQLVYIPQETFTVSANTTLKPDASVVQEFGALVSYSFVGYRYYTEDNTDFLPSHQLVNASVRSRFVFGRLAMLTKFEVNNLFNEEYQVMLGYPMPMRSYRFTLTLEY